MFTDDARLSINSICSINRNKILGDEEFKVNVAILFPDIFKFNQFVVLVLLDNDVCLLLKFIDVKFCPACGVIVIVTVL